MTEIVSRKHVGVLYLLVKIHKTLKVRQGGLKQILKWKLSDWFSSVGLSNQLHRHRNLVWPGIVDIGAKPKSFDFWLTLRFASWF
jgi:hypothetical protein